MAIKHRVSGLNDQFYIIFICLCCVLCFFFVKRKNIFKVSLAFSGSFSFRNYMKLRERSLWNEQMNKLEKYSVLFYAFH